MKRIKIAEVITRMDWGGAPDIVRVLCTYLDPDIYDVTLITGNTKYPSKKTKEFLKIFKGKIIIVPYLRRNINPLYDLLSLIRLFNIFRKERFDVIHTHTAKAGILGRIAAIFYGKSAIVHTLHGHNLYGYFGPVLSKVIVLIERYLAYSTDKIICLTELEKKDLLKYRIGNADKVVVIYQGLELDRYLNVNADKIKLRKDLNIKVEENVVSVIGRLEPVKGVKYFIKVAVDLAEKFPNIRFLMVGEGSLHKSLEKQVEDLGLKDKFIFTGWREDIPEILSIVDILVLPSLNEAVGMVLIEAQAQGIPVVATSVGGIPEIVKNNQTGILVPAKDSRSLAQAVKYLLEDKQKRLQMGEEGRLWIMDKFKANDMVNSVSDLYKNLVNVYTHVTN